ncbi:hypothetical protein K6V26_20745 [Parabacteroides goldsteinii]|jgi:hypothetical protein|uniref:hypothetical protein n=1 Tax=Parabacteroides goldsteinii TaxID=328812 RepID=UPI001CC94A62|nr:hypothetical protein [Parabacteroides goldsteinii]UBD73549.1 hypothetical protein K6V26_20745 [Parabacteroides goldsteinii]
MHDLFILMLGGSFAAKIEKRLEKENKDSLSKAEILEYLAIAAIETVESLKEREKIRDLKNNPSQN